MKIGNLETHPAADAFPLMIGEAFKAFVDDIKANGMLDNEGWLAKDGRILDARNRARAAEQLGLEMVWKTYEGDDVESFVLSKNLHRRNMNESQRAIVAARFATRPRGRAKKDARVHLPTLAELADQADVGEVTLKAAKQVLAGGAPELVAAVDAGELAVTRAAELAQLPHAEQLEQLRREQPEPRDQLQRKRAEKAGDRRPPDEVLLTTATRAWLRLGATIETLAVGEVLVQYDGLTFELRLQRANPGKGRAA